MGIRSEVSVLRDVTQGCIQPTLMDAPVAEAEGARSGVCEKNQPTVVVQIPGAAVTLMHCRVVYPN